MPQREYDITIGADGNVELHDQWAIREGLHGGGQDVRENRGRAERRNRRPASIMNRKSRFSIESINTIEERFPGAG
jgi:hypothetical protein